MILLHKKDTFPSGKYKGRQVSDIIRKDPTYILKISENLKTFAFTDDVIEATYDEIINNDVVFGDDFDY